MISSLLRELAKLSRLLRRYPPEPLVRPQVFMRLGTQCVDSGPLHIIAFQSVSDRFYFLLFGAIVARMASKVRLRADVVVVRAVNSAVGTSWISNAKRSALVVALCTQPWVRAYGSLISGVAYRSASWENPFRNLADWRRSLGLWRQLQASGETPSLLIDGVQVADLIVDSYLRFKPALTFDAQDPFVRRLIWQATMDIRRAGAYFDRNHPCCYLTSYTTYLEHGLATRVALNRGVPVWSFGSLARFAKRLSLVDPYQSPDCSTYRENFAALDCKKERLDEARTQLEIRLSGGVDAATSYMRRSAYGGEDVALPDGLAGAAVIFLHDFFDSPHLYPNLVFCDFWRWICFTIETLESAGVCFFIKPHPNQIALSNAGLGMLKMKYPRLRWLHAFVSNDQLAKAGISCGITVFGTIAHELAYLGIPSIGCARHPHHSFEFCRTARNSEEYAELLRRHDELPVSKDELQRQALEFYYMHNIHGEVADCALRKAFVSFWNACNGGVASDAEVMAQFHALVTMPEFERFVECMHLDS